ncbi:MAG: ThuA domain-containing protein [Planctomycetota bacterium]
MPSLQRIVSWMLIAVTVMIATAAADDKALTSAPHQDVDAIRVLVFSRTQGYRHASIPDGIAMMGRLAERHHARLRCTEDAGMFTEDALAPFNVIVFLNTTGDVLNDEQQAALRLHLEGGAGFVGIHSASDTEYDWPWYGELVGAYFKGHPPVQPATMNVESDVHPSTSHLAATWARTDEWYDFRANPRDDVTVLLTVDESTYAGGGMGEDHPISWCHDRLGIRSFYTAIGHTSASYEEPAFQRHVWGGIAWAAGTSGRPPASQPHR